MRRLFLFITLISSCFLLRAQQEPAISQYAFHGLYLNPARAGQNGYSSASAVSRNQWLGFPGAPKTNMFSVDGPLPALNMGLGLMVVHDQIGVTSSTDVYGIYSYHLKTGTDSRLSFGLKAGVANFRENLSDLQVWDEDYVFNDNIHSRWVPKFGFGLFYYSEDYYAGISIPTLLAYDPHYSFSLDLEKSSFYRHHVYLTGGYVFELNHDFKIKPFTLIKYVPGMPVQADINAAAFYKERYVLGLGYRSSTSFTAFAELRINSKLRIGYACDFLHSTLSKYSGGSHEILLGFDFGGSIRDFKHIRYF